jgi:hypothetical protein
MTMAKYEVIVCLVSSFRLEYKINHSSPKKSNIFVSWNEFILTDKYCASRTPISVTI